LPDKAAIIYMMDAGKFKQRIKRMRRVLEGRLRFRLIMFSREDKKSQNDAPDLDEQELEKQNGDTNGQPEPIPDAVNDQYVFVEQMENGPVRKMDLDKCLEEYDPDKIEGRELPEEEIEAELGDMAFIVLDAIRDMDFESPADYVHPEYGLMFCPSVRSRPPKRYGFITGNDSQLRN
jgi:hypothetical protein